MGKSSQRCCGLIPLAVSQLIALAIFEPVAPLQAAPPEPRPEFRELLSEQDYEQRQKAALTELGSVQDLIASGLPAVGIEILREPPQRSQAREAGVATGDILVRLDGEVPGRNEDLEDTDAFRKLEFFQRRTRKIKSVKVSRAPLGVNGRWHWKPEMLYLQGKNRDPRWESHVLVGITQRLDSPDLAETAWKKAMDAGYPLNCLAAQCGAEMALNQGRNSEAWAFAGQAIETCGSSSEPLDAILIHRVALANGRLKELAAFVEKHPRDFHFSADTLFRIQDLASEGREKVDPSRAIVPMYADRLETRIANLFGEANSRFGLAQLRRGEPLKVDAPTDHLHRFYVRTLDPVSSLEFTAKFRVAPTDTKEGEYAKFVVFGLTDVPSDELKQLTMGEDESPTLRVTIRERGEIQIKHSDVSTSLTYQSPDMKVDGRDLHDLRLITALGQGQVILDGKCVAWVPVDSTPRPRLLMLKAVGMTLQLQDVRLTEFAERPAAN